MTVPIIAAAVAATVKTTSGLSALRVAAKLAMDLKNQGSLVGYSRVGRIEPMVMIDTDLRAVDFLPDVLQTLQSVFAAYYLRAVSMHNITISGASIAQRLERFSTHRDPVTAASLGMMAATESYEDRLPRPGEAPRTLSIGNEAFGFSDGMPSGKGRMTDVVDPKRTVDADAKVISSKSTSTGGPKDQGAFDRMSVGQQVDIFDAPNMVTGKMISVTIRADGTEVTVPMVVHLNCVYVESSPLVQIMGGSSIDVSFGARWKQYSLGRIDFWKDLMLCQDLIDEHKKNLRADKTGLYMQMMQKQSTNAKAALVSGTPSANSASNITVLSKETATALELKIGGRLQDFKVRQRLFQEGYGMLMVVIDKQRARARVYTRDIPEYTELSDREMKASNKNGGPDVGDILTAFRAGSAPRL